MGLAQSHAQFFRPTQQQHESDDTDDDIDPLELLYKVERKLWRNEPSWLKPPPRSQRRVRGAAVSNNQRDETTDAKIKPRRVAAQTVDPMGPMSASQALALVPSLMDEKWVAPLVALIDSADAVIQSTGLALLASAIRSDTAEEVFLKAGGVVKVMAACEVDSPNAKYLALEVVHALCSRTARVTSEFCERGLAQHLLRIASLDEKEPEHSGITLAALKILRLVLAHGPSRNTIPSSDIMPLLLKLTQSSQLAVAHMAVMCVGLSLSDPANMAKIVELRCVDALLKLVLPPNPNPCAVLQALSLIAEEDPGLFSKDLTIMTMTRILDTLRGGAKRSRTASACAYLFASLAKSPALQSGLCVEGNLSILSKLLVGGSLEVLKASTFAIGIAASEGSNMVTEILYNVEAPDNLLKLLDSALDDELTRLLLFAIASLVDVPTVLPTGIVIQWLQQETCSDALRQRMRGLCKSVVDGSERIGTVLRLLTSDISSASTFAAKVISGACSRGDIRQRVTADRVLVLQLCNFLVDAAPGLLSSLLLFFIECSSQAADPTLDNSTQFCELVADVNNQLDVFVGLFGVHEPFHLVGLLTAFKNFASHSPSLRVVLSCARVIEYALALLTRAKEVELHVEVLAFLDEMTRHKNHVAIANIFTQSPDRIANLLYSQDGDLLPPVLNVARRIFKHHNNPSTPSSGARRQLAMMLGDEDSVRAVAAMRVWGNLLLHHDKRVAFAVLPNAVELLLRLIRRCHHALSKDSKARNAVLIKNCIAAIRTLSRGVTDCGEMKNEVASASSFLVVFDLFDETDERVMKHAVQTARCIAPVLSLKKFILVPSVLQKLSSLLGNRDLVTIGSAHRVAWLTFVTALCRRDSHSQRMLAEFGVVDAIVMLVQSPAATLNQDVLKECLEALAWLCTGEANVRKKIASTPKLIDLSLRYMDCPRDALVAACLHLLQRVTCSDDCNDEKAKIRQSGGGNAIMRAIQVAVARRHVDVMARACALVRNLVSNDDLNKSEFQRLGFNPTVVRLITQPDLQPNVKLLVRGLQSVAAMSLGMSTIAKTSKRETLECDNAHQLLQLLENRMEPKLCLAWCQAAVSLVQSSPHNQKKLVESKLTSLVVGFVTPKASSAARLHITAARLLACMASFPENRLIMMSEGGDALMGAIIAGLQSDIHDVQRYIALLIAHLATRNDASKIRIGAWGTTACLVDRLSSKQSHVLENVLQAIVKLGTHAGNKVKYGSRICFEKLLSLAHHDELAIRKGAISAIAVLIEGNDVNKKFLLQCEASVVPELCALMKSSNGKIVESAMLILGELSQLADQILEISKSIDIVAIVRMVEHVNPRIRRAALHTVLNLTKESFNKLRFGIPECIDAMLTCLQSEDMLLVELAMTCLANLSFLDSNASRIAQHHDSMAVLLKLAAASTASRDNLSWNEARSLGLGKNTQVNRPISSPSRKSAPVSSKSTAPAEVALATTVEEAEEDEIDDKLEPFVYSAVLDTQSEHDVDGGTDNPQLLDFSSFPTRQTSVLEQTLLVLSNCSQAYHLEHAVEKVAVKIIGQALSHPSELVKRCGCYILAVWCKKDTKNQRYTTKQGILPVLIQLLNSPNVNVVEAAIYLLGKLAYYGDNHLKLLQLDFLTTMVQTILRKPTNLTHEGLMDRTIRVLGTLVRFPRVRQTIKSEEIIADILTQLLQIHRPLAKNTSRLILGMLEEDSLRFFLPKKTVMLLRVFLTDHHGASPKTIRNILCVFQRIATVEEHKTTIALEDSGETVTRLIQELRVVDTIHKDSSHLPANAATVLSLLTYLAPTRKIAILLHEKDVYSVLPVYVGTSERISSGENAEALSDDDVCGYTKQLYATRPILRDALVVARHMCVSLGDRGGSRLSHAGFARLLIEVLQVPELLANSTTLLPEYFECFTVLDRLSGYSRDQQYFAESAAADIVLRCLQQWMDVAERDGTLAGRHESQSEEAPIDLVMYVTPIVHIVHRMAENDANKDILIQSGGIPLVLQCLDVGLLTDNQRLVLARALRLLFSLGIASEWFDTHDLVLPLFRFLHKHRHHSELRVLCLGCVADMLETSVLSRRRVIGQPQVLKFLLECLQNAADESADQVYFAINALECMSMEPELAETMAQLGSGLLELVPSLLLVPDASIARPTQYFALEMVGYMASYGHADKLGLNAATVERMVRFLDFITDETITGEVIALTLWTLAHLVRQPSSSVERVSTATTSRKITQWIAQSEAAVGFIIRAGLTPSDQLGTSSSVTANMLTVLLAVCTSESSAVAIRNIVNHHRTICTSISIHLEAVEREVNLPALRLLAICMVASGCEHPPAASTQDSNFVEEAENWSTVLRHLMEWMEVFARDPEQCPAPSLSDAFVCLSQITSVESLSGEFCASINRSGLAEIVCNAITYLDPKRRSTNGNEDEGQDTERKEILTNALKICGNLMEFTPAYCERFFFLNVPQAIESVLMLDDDDIVVECLVCMSHLADWSSNRQLLFSSLRCVSRLADLLRHKDFGIVARITPLLVLLSSRIPSLPGLCTIKGVRILCDCLTMVTDWHNRDRSTTRVTDDCAAILLSLFSTEDSVILIYDQVDVVGRMFGIVVQQDAPEIPLRILAKISSSGHSHARFLQLLTPMSRLLCSSSKELGSASQHLVLCILFNLFCRADDADATNLALKAGEGTVLQQLLPLGRWTTVTNVASVRIVIKILHTYVNSSAYRELLNDGRNVPALLRLIADTNDDISGAAAQLMLTAIAEREVEIAVTVEDGIAVLVRTLQKTSKWHLQCLLLAILRNMCHDAEVPVLIMNEDGVSRLVHFVRERKGMLFAADERLAHACKILRYVSAVPAPGTATRIVDARGHIRLIELATHQESTTNDSERATTMEILSNLAASGEVSTQLTESKLHEHSLRWVVAAPPSSSEKDRESIPHSRRLALNCLRSLCKYSKTARQDTASAAARKAQLIGLLEKWLSLLQFGTLPDNPAGGVTTKALAVLMYLSKTQTGRHAIYALSSPQFIERVCAVILAAQLQTDTTGRGPIKQQEQQPAQARASVIGLKLLGNLLSDPSPERFRVSWVCDHLVELLPLVQKTLADHQHSKLQLHALNALQGSYDGQFYFPVSTQMLSDLFNIVLISPTARHAEQAENVIIKAFEREEQIQIAIAGNQILEQLLIVFSQRVEAPLTQALRPQRRPLAPALTQVLNVSTTRGFIVNPRFTSKIVTILSTSSVASKAELCPSNGNSRFSSLSDWWSEDDDEDMLTAALAAYLAFVFKTSPASALSASPGHSTLSSFQQSIRDALQSEVNVSALTTLVLLLLGIHDRVCPRAIVVVSATATETPKGSVSAHGSSSGTAVRPRTLNVRDLLIWNLISHCLWGGNGKPQPAHIVELLQDVPHAQWVCMLNDMFSQLACMQEASGELDGVPSGNVIPTTVTVVDATIQVLHVLSVVATNTPAKPDTTDARRLEELCARSFQVIHAACSDGLKTSSSLKLVNEALQAITCIRAGWGEEVVVQSFQHLRIASQLIQQWLGVFMEPSALLDEARASTLQLFLLLVSSGARIDDFKEVDVRGAIENNEHIPAALKSVGITILSLLGYNADLNVEFQLAIDRFGEAEAFTQRKEALSYLTNFLQLYTLTDESLQEVAIEQCMRRLVDDVNVIAHESNQPNGGNNDEVMACIRDYLVCLGKLSQSRKFVELYMRQWNTNAFLAVCFTRRRALNRGGLRDCTVLSFAQIADALNICAKITDALSATTSAGTLSDTIFLNAMVLLDDLPHDQLPLCERVVDLLAWSVDNEDTFDLMCKFAGRLRSVLRFVPTLSDAGVQSLTTILDALTKRVHEIELLGELLTELLTCVYRNANKLKNGVREKMLLYILMILKRMGEDDLSACSIYEQSIQVILANAHVPAEMPARCSWDLLGVLSELDPAIVTIFNFEGIQIMLNEFCGPTSAVVSNQLKGNMQPSTPPVRRVLSTRKSALGPADRAAGGVSSSVASEAMYRRLEALKCLSKAARNHDEVLQKIGETLGIGAHLFRILAGNGTSIGTAETDSAPAVASAAQEHAAHLIARIASQELHRASLLSQDHVSTLIESLESVHPKIVLHALEALFYLSEFAMCLDALVRHATVPVLAQILVSPLVEENASTQQNAELFVLGLLANMCAKSKVIGRRVVSSNLLPRLRVFLASTRGPIQLYAIWVIKSVSKDSELVAKLHEQRIAEAVMDMLLSYEPLRTQRKAFGVLCNMITGHRIGTAFVDDDVLRVLARTVVEAMHPLVVCPQPTAHRSLARALTVLDAMASLSQTAKDMLCDDDDDVDTRAIPLVLQLLDSIHSDVKLQALQVISHWVDEHTDRDKLKRVLLVEAPLLSLVRAISDEQGECLLVALTLLNTLLAIDDELKSKFSAMTNEVLLRLLPTLVPTSSDGSYTLPPVQLRALNEALKSLVAVARGVTSGGCGGGAAAGSVGALAPNHAAAIGNAIDPLVELLRLSTASDNLRLNAMYLLVSFAGSVTELRPRMLLNGMMAACIRMLTEAPLDDKLLQLCLLGMALLTSNAVDFTCVVPDLLRVVDLLLVCLASKNASVQANAVWVVSNICGEERLKGAIASRGGATTLQTILHEAVSETASRGANVAVANGGLGPSRPLSSSQRIREYAPKAIKSLGYAPMTPGPSSKS